jgi:hypothetical protein
MANPKSVALKAVPPNPMNVQQKKYYVFNETGNIMLASTTTGDTPISESVQQVFSEVAVFFAALTKALSTTLKPKKKPTDPDVYYSLYDYEALRRVIDGSGLFVQVTQEDVLYKTQKIGVEFSKELISSLLGLATGTGEMTFASAMIASMGSASTLKIGESSSSDQSKVSNIVFVCEYLLGMPIVSAIVVYADANQETFKLNIGPCFSTSEMHTKLQMHKDTYMFVTPAFIKEYAGDLLSIETSVDYNELVQELSGIITGNPEINDIEDTKTKKSVKTAASLTPGDNLLLSGMNFGPLGTVSLGGTDITITAGSWTNTGITFTVPNVNVTDASPVLLTTASGKTAAIGSYTVAKKSSRVAANHAKK